jgi:DNA polymerase-3 subunit alpha
MRAVAELGMSAIALTDNDTLAGAPDLLWWAERTGIKPIVGCSLGVKDGAWAPRLLMLAADNGGYRSLCRLVTMAHRQEPGLPHITLEQLGEHTSGLVVICSGWGAPVIRDVARADVAAARRAAERLASAMAEPDSLYLSVQHHDLVLPGGLTEAEANSAIVEIAHTTGLGLVATSQVLYLERADALVRTRLAAWSAINGGEPLGCTKGSDEFYLRNPAEVRRVLGEFPEALQETLGIADRCNIEMRRGVHVPVDRLVGERTIGEVLRETCERGLVSRYGKSAIDGASDRLDHELRLLEENGLSEYALLLADVVGQLRSSHIETGPGRGPCLGSLVLYLLGVTQVDPLEWHLVFERWLGRLDIAPLPYMNLAIDHERRRDITTVLRARYGEERVALTLEARHLGGAAAARRAAAVLGVDESVWRHVEEACGRDKLGLCDPTALRESMQLLGLDRTEHAGLEQVAEFRLQLEGLIDSHVEHADWWSPPSVVVGDKDLSDITPVEARADGARYTQFGSFSMDQLGYPVIRVSGVRSLTMLRRAREIISERHHLHVDLDTLPLDDQATLELFAIGDTSGVYLYEAPPVRQMLVALSARSMEDLAVAYALWRLADRDLELAQEFLGRQDTGAAEILHPVLRPILGATRGMYLFEEQLQHVWRAFSSLPYTWTERLRRAAQRRDREQLEPMRVEWFRAGELSGYDSDELENVWSDSLFWAAHTFPKAHALGEAMLGYRCAYVKAHFPAEFLEANYDVFGEQQFFGFDVDYHNRSW